MQKQASRGCRGTCGRSIECRKNRWNIFARNVSATNIEHGADEISHHVVQKSVSSHAIDEQSAGFLLLLCP